MIQLGSEVVVIGIEDARKLKRLAAGRSKEEYERLQALGVLGVLQQIRDAVDRYDASFDRGGGLLWIDARF